MTLSTRHRPQPASDLAPEPVVAARQSRTAAGGIAVAGAGLLFVVAQDGSVPWQITRFVTVAALLAGLLVMLRRLPFVRQGVLESAAGLLFLPVGIGIGLPHLAKAGAHPLTVAGLLSLAGGVVLLVVGAATLIRARRRWVRPAIGLAHLLLAGLVTLTIGQAVAATNVPRTDVGATTPADRGMAYRDVEFRTSDGVRLSGWYVPSKAGAAVVLLHGAGSTRSGVLDHAVVLGRAGYGVLLFDARGHGRSGGRAMDFGWYGDADIAAAVTFLQAQPDVDDGRIGAVGMSMGGEEAIGAAAGDPRMKAVVAEGATNRGAGDKAWLSDEYGLRGALQEGVERLVFGAADLLTAASPPVTLHDAVAASAPRPVLLIAGGAMADEAKAGRYIQSGSPSTVELWEVAGAGHTGGLRTDPNGWEQRVTSFLGAALR
jgi:dienelactone hydrolase